MNRPAKIEDRVSLQRKQKKDKKGTHSNPFFEKKMKKIEPKFLLDDSESIESSLEEEKQDGEFKEIKKRNTKADKVNQIFTKLSSLNRNRSASPLKKKKELVLIEMKERMAQKQKESFEEFSFGEEEESPDQKTHAEIPDVQEPKEKKEKKSYELFRKAKRTPKKLKVRMTRAEKIKKTHIRTQSQDYESRSLNHFGEKEDSLVSKSKRPKKSQKSSSVSESPKKKKLTHAVRVDSERKNGKKEKRSSLKGSHNAGSGKRELQEIPLNEIGKSAKRAKGRPYKSKKEPRSTLSGVNLSPSKQRGNVSSDKENFQAVSSQKKPRETQRKNKRKISIQGIIQTPKSIRQTPDATHQPANEKQKTPKAAAPVFKEILKSHQNSKKKSSPPVFPFTVPSSGPLSIIN